MNKYVSIDIGGTAIKYGIIHEDAEIICKRSMKTEAWKGGPSILQKVTGIVEEMKQEAQEEISGICISTAGMVDTKEGSIFYSAPLIPDYAGTQFKKTLEEMFQVPCEVENDVNCAGLAENRSGAAKGAKIALVLTIGTGIGGCIVIDGKVFHGFSNSACEVGYMHMDDSDFQTLGAASILTKKVAEWKSEQEDIWDGYHIFEEAKKGDELCNRAIDETVVLLSHKKPDSHINIKVEFGEGEGKVPLKAIAERAEAYKPKERVTYKMIKEYIEAKYGFKVHTAYIAEVKRDLGLPMYDAPNAVEELKNPRKHPTAEKVEAIKDALKYFEVI